MERQRIVIFAGGAKEDSYKKIRGNSYGMWIATEINLHHDNTIKGGIQPSVSGKAFENILGSQPGQPTSTDLHAVH